MFVRCILLTSFMFLAGCGGRQTAAESGKLMETVNAFNLMVRWQQWQSAAPFIHSKYRDKWMISHLKSSRDVRIAEVIMAGVKRNPPEAEVATTFVQITWYGANSPTVRTSLWEQQWKLIDKGDEEGWRLMSEKPAEEAPPEAEAPDDGPSWP